MVVLAARLAGGRAGGGLVETTRERVRGPSLAQSALLDEALLGDLGLLDVQRQPVTHCAGHTIR